MACELAGLCKVGATLREPSSSEAARGQRKQMPGRKHNRTAGQGCGPQEVEPPGTEHRKTPTAISRLRFW